MTERYLTTNELSALTDVPVGTISTARRGGTIRAARPGKRGRPDRGCGDGWTLSQALGLVVARLLQARGVYHRFAWPCGAFLAALSAEQLQAWFAEGRTYIAVVGFTCLPRLISKQAYENQAAENAEDMAAVGMTPFACDVSVVVAKLRERLAAMDAGAAPPVKTPRRRKTKGRAVKPAAKVTA